MRTRGLLILLFVSLLANGFFLIRQWQSSVVISVPDGDSLQLVDGRRIRLLGIDAPERGRCMAEEAREELGKLALRKRVMLKDIVTDDYGRVLAHVFLFVIPGLTRNPSISLNQQMAQKGFARGEGDGPAKAARLGIYSEACRKSISPDGCAIKGNIREGKSVYYPEGCTYYDQVIVDEAYGDQWFCTEAEAKEAGFSIAASCQ